MKIKFKTGAAIAAAAATVFALTGCGEPRGTANDVTQFWNSVSCPNTTINTNLAYQIKANTNIVKLRSCELTKSDYLEAPTKYTVETTFNGDREKLKYMKSFQEASQYANEHTTVRELSLSELNAKMQADYDKASTESTQELQRYNQVYTDFIESAAAAGASANTELLQDVKADDFNSVLDSYIATVNSEINALTPCKTSIQPNQTGTCLGKTMTFREVMIQSSTDMMKITKANLLRM